MGKALARRHKQSVARAWRNIFIKSGILRGGKSDWQSN
ncbi:DUF3983 domain-containing protein [Sutcliffiella horikoshii]|uniref:DUF3983 domain-containing protein n=1 Tax=Sutcliffiella horikoshii TaxID=79883 RepID=A0A5D4SX03_9BACI|nr:DUF3983 domain-containing protein [Sutcliffiella horikoshii]